MHSAGHLKFTPGDFCTAQMCEASAIVIFGGSGDLTRRKLIPALFRLYKNNLLPKKSIIIGTARSQMTHEAFREKQAGDLKELHPDASEEKLTEFLNSMHYAAGSYDSLDTYAAINEELKEADAIAGRMLPRIYYLAVPSSLYPVIVPMMDDSGLLDDSKTPVRVILEKPFGYDSASAAELDHVLHNHLKESNIYRIDHYLGKDTVQNILMLRFANLMFEPVWNNHYIDSVQITVAESLGVGHRAGYYDKAGLLRDMFQNHLLQMLALAAMEPPSSFEASAVREEKVKLVKCIQPFNLKELEKSIVRGQYTAGEINGEKVPGYLEEPNIPGDSKTETYACAKFMIDNWRWKGTPFYLRSGKRLSQRLSEISIVFKSVPHSIFTPMQPEDLGPNVLTLTVQPKEGMNLAIQAKQPGPKLCMGTLGLNFRYSDLFGGDLPDAYEHLLLDAMCGDQTLFIRSDMIQQSWELFTPVLKAWESDPDIPLHPYPAGSWGPDAAENIPANDGKSLLCLGCGEED